MCYGMRYLKDILGPMDLSLELSSDVEGKHSLSSPREAKCAPGPAASFLGTPDRRCPYFGDARIDRTTYYFQFAAGHLVLEPRPPESIAGGLIGLLCRIVAAMTSTRLRQHHRAYQGSNTAETQITGLLVSFFVSLLAAQVSCRPGATFSTFAKHLRFAGAGTAHSCLVPCMRARSAEKGIRPRWLKLDSGPSERCAVNHREAFDLYFVPPPGCQATRELAPRAPFLRAPSSGDHLAGLYGKAFPHR